MKKILRIVWRFLLLAVIVVFGLIVYPFFWFAAKLANHFGTKYIRCRKGQIQLPIITYQAKKNGQTLMFAPTIPLADPEYYAELHKLIRVHQTSGYSILYDKIQPLTYEHRLKLQRGEWEAKKQLQSVYAGLRWTKQIMSLASQPRSLPYKKNRRIWLNVDMLEIELLARMSATKSSFFQKLPDFDSLPKDQELTKWILTKFFNRLVLVAMVVELYVRFSRKNRKLLNLMIQGRNEIGQICISHVSKGNILMIWGAERYSDLSEVLQTIGYKVVTKRWVPAYQLRKTGWRVPFRLAWQFVTNEK